ncbi:unnamed protein product [Colias eurytheme]|nr:unnamed protein product [Colias eurytheme]
MGLFTPLSGDVANGRRGSGGCDTERARVPGRFVIATEAVLSETFPGPAIVARCEVATVNSCAQGGEWRHTRARWLRRLADSMRAAARPAPT